MVIITSDPPMRYFLLIFLAFLLLVSPAPSFAGTLEQGRAAMTGTAANYNEAFAILMPLAENGDAEAQYLVGMLYKDGRGTKQNYAAGNKWVRTSADQGYKMAQLSIGNGLAHLVDKSQDVQAYMWLTLSDATGEKHATGMLADLTARMSPEQISEAKRLVATWKPTLPPANGYCPKDKAIDLAKNDETVSKICRGYTYGCRYVDMGTNDPHLALRLLVDEIDQSGKPVQKLGGDLIVYVTKQCEIEDILREQ